MFGPGIEIEPNSIVRWEDLIDQTGKIPIRLHRSVLLSDESIVGHYAHEVSEIESLRRRLADAGGRMSVEEFRDLVSPGDEGNPHGKAWDDSNALIRTKRERASRSHEGAGP